jgi:anti-anti-sigma factor
MPVFHEALVTIALRGAYDISSADALRRALSRGIYADTVIVDVSAVTYAGTTLLNALLDLRARMREHGSAGVIRLVGSSASLRRILSITRLDRVFDVN